MPKQVAVLCAALGFLLAGGSVRAEEPYRHWGVGTDDQFYDAQYFGKQEKKVFVLFRGGGVRFKLEEKLSEDDRKYLATNPSGKLLQPFESVAPSKEVQELGPASDALVRLFARSDTAAMAATGVVFHAAGDEAFIYVIGAWDDGAKEIEAVLPRKDNGRRIKLKELAGGIGLSYQRVVKQVPILVGLRSELPEPIKIPANVYDPVGTKLRVVGDAVPTQYGTERNVERLVLPGEFVEYQGRSVLPEEENWEGRWAFDMFENLSVYQGLIVDDRGTPRYMIGWTKPTFKAMKHRRSPLVPVDFFTSLKVGNIVGFRVGDSEKPDEIAVDFALYSLPGAIKKIVVKTGLLPAGDSVRQRFEAFLGSLDSAEPPKLVELGEFKPSDVPVAAMRKGLGAQYKPADAPSQSYSFRAPGTAEYLVGEPIPFVVYLRDEQGRDELCRTLTLPVRKPAAGR